MLNSSPVTPIISKECSTEILETYIQELQRNWIYYLVGKPYFNYPLPMELTSDMVVHLSQNQRRVFDFYINKINAIEFETMDEQDYIHMFWNRIWSREQIEAFKASVTTIWPALTVDYLLVTWEDWQPEMKILEISPRVSYIDYRFPDIAKVQRQGLSVWNEYFNRIWSSQEELDTLRRYRDIDESIPIFVLKPHRWDQPVQYDLRKQAEKGKSQYPIDPTDVYIKDWQYYWNLRNERGDIVHQDVWPITYILNVLTEEDFKDIEKKSTETSKQNAVFQFLCEGTEIQRSFPPGLRRFLSKRDMHSERFKQDCWDLSAANYASWEILPEGLFFLKSDGWTSGHGAKQVYIWDGKVQVIANQALEEVYEGNSFVVPQWYVAQEFMYPYPVPSIVHTNKAQEPFQDRLQTVEVRCMSPRRIMNGLTEMPVHFWMRSSCRTDVGVYKSLKEQLTWVPAHIIHAISHPLTNVWKSLWAMTANQQLYGIQGWYGSNAMWPIYIKAQKVLYTNGTLPWYYAQQIVNRITHAQENEKKNWIPDGIKTKTEDQLIHTWNSLCIVLGETLIWYTNLTSLAYKNTPVTKVWTVIVNPEYYGKGVLHILRDSILENAWNTLMIIKTCEDRLVHVFWKEWFEVHSQWQLHVANDELAEFVESPDMWWTTAPNKVILHRYPKLS